jgi:hypothetical protein
LGLLCWEFFPAFPKSGDSIHREKPGYDQAIQKINSNGKMKNLKSQKIQISKNSGTSPQKRPPKTPNLVNTICATSVILVLGSQLIPNCSPVLQKFRAWGENWGFEFYNQKEACQPPNRQN